MALGEGSSSIYRCIPSCPTLQFGLADEEGCIVSDSYCSNCYRFVPRKYCEDCYTCLFYELRGVKEENEIVRAEGEKQLGIIENLREEMRLLREEGTNQVGQIIRGLRQQISSLRSESAKQSGIIQKMQQEIEILRADAAKQDKSAEEEIEFLRKISSEALATPDVTLCASDGSRFKAHSLILVNRSDVFRAMFEGDLMQQKKGVIMIKEVGDKIIRFQVVANEMGKQNIVMKEVGGESVVFQVAGFMANRRAEVIVEEVGGDSLKVFLNFLYTRKVDDNEIFANYKQLARLAAIFQIKLLFTRLNLCLEAFLQGRHSIGY
ncbi:hypothetical protein SUGI_1061840 [Cryptomeria japonica]|nr:hypothetical protein SUGI_1061840 [Cryptomeria japonica]